jgi:hypothetical protein
MFSKILIGGHPKSVRLTLDIEIVPGQDEKESEFMVGVEHDRLLRIRA